MLPCPDGFSPEAPIRALLAEEQRVEPTPGAVWFDSARVCALADAERHLGHAVRAHNEWIAYDAIHPNDRHDGFLLVGVFESLTMAKFTIEASVRIRGNCKEED